MVSTSIANSLDSARRAIRQMDWSAALDDIRAAQALRDPTARDEYAINELLAYVLCRQNKYDESAAIDERLLQSPLLSRAEIDERTKTMAALWFRVGDYSRAAYWAKQYLETHPDQLQFVAMLGDAYFRQNDFLRAARSMQAEVTRAEQAGQIPKESWLRIIDDSYYRLTDVEGMEGALRELVRYYHRPQDWRELIDLYSEGVHDERLAFEYRHLMFDLDVLTRPDDYEYLVQEAVEAGVPALARDVLLRAKTNQVFEAPPDRSPGRYARLEQLVDRQMPATRARLAKLTEDAKTARTGVDDMQAGQNHLSYDEYQQASDALARGIAKGRLDNLDEARVDLGIAYYERGKKHLADEAFRAVALNSSWHGLAELWTLRAEQFDRVSRLGKSKYSMPRTANWIK
jgi:tetratricopeptide (TPR) repeat protein